MTKPVEDIDIPVPWGHISGVSSSKVMDKSDPNSTNEKISHKSYSCDKCNAKYFNKSSWNRHIKLKHSTSVKEINFIEEKVKETRKDDDVKDHTCDICGMKYDFKFKLLRHMKIKHENVECSVGLNSDTSSSTVWFKCQDCERSFILWKSLLRHYRLNHPGLAVPKRTDSGNSCKNSSEKFLCNLCQIEYFTDSGLKTHMIKYHVENDGNKSLPKLSECSICNYKAVKSKPLFEHYSKVHSIEIRSEILNFKSYDEFLEWKEKEEKRSLNKYVNQHGQRKYKNGLVVRYFYCHRSGCYRQKGNGKRQLKHQGSKKYGKICPSRMLVKIISADSVKVDYIASHVGHDAEVCHLTLSQNERIAIANKIEMKMTFDDILKEINSGSMEANDLVKKSDCVTRKDLHNIVRSFNLTPVRNELIKLKKKRLRTGNQSKVKNHIANKSPKSIKDIKQNDQNKETSVVDIGIPPSKNDESTKSQIYFDLHELVIIGNNITNNLETEGIINALPVSVTSHVPLLSHVSCTSQVISTLQTESLCSKQEEIIYASENFEEPRASVNFEESKQNLINDLVYFMSENVNNVEELQIAKEITSSFMDAFKRRKENLIVISS